MVRLILVVFAPVLIGAFVSGCAARSGSEWASLQIDVRSASAPSLMKAFDSVPSGDSISALATPPTAVSGFSCLAFNIMGEGIQPENGRVEELNRFPVVLAGNSYCSYPGVTSPPVPMGGINGSANIELSVPTGKNRLVQALGVMETTKGLCSRTTPVGQIQDNEGDFYELGRSVIDVFQDLSVSLAANFNSLTTADQANRKVNCGSTTVTGPVVTPSTFQMSGPSSFSGGCNLLTVTALDASATPVAVNPGFAANLSVSGVTGTFYASTDCSGSSGSSVIIPSGSDHISFSLKITVGGSSANVTASATGVTSGGWSRPYVYSSCASGATVLDSQYNAGANAASGDTNDKAQSFTLSNQATISSVSLGGWIHPVGPSSGTVTLAIYPDQSGMPDRSGSALASCVASLPTTVGDMTCTFSSKPTLSANVTYWLVAENSNQSFVVQGCNGACTASSGGSGKYYTGSTWAAAPNSALRYIYGVNGCAF